MILIIDAYNVLKYVFGAATITHHQRAEFIHQLYRYAQGKKIRPLVVFDGGPSVRPFTEQHHTVTVIYPGNNSSADDYIVRYIQQTRSQELLLVSSDRALVAKAHAYNIASIDAQLFWTIMQRALTEKRISPTTRANQGQSIKLTSDTNPELDTLMKSATIPHSKDDEIISFLHEQGHSLSKNDRTLLKKLKKLL